MTLGPPPGKKGKPLEIGDVVVPPANGEGHEHEHDGHGHECDHSGHEHEHEHEHEHSHGHEHSDACRHHGHHHDQHGHDEHDPHGHHHHHHEEKPPENPPGSRSAETGGEACQLDLSIVIPGETDEIGRFQKLEQLLKAHRGIDKVHIRRDLGRAEVCVHYDCHDVSPASVISLLRAGGADVCHRYLMKTWLVHGMDCPQCGFVIEHALGRAKGVLQASVGYTTGRLVVEYDAELAKPSELEARVRALGYELEEPEEGHEHHHTVPPAAMPLSLAAGALIAVAWALGRFAGAPALLCDALYAAAGVAGGWYAARDAIHELGEGQVDIDTLMVLAAAGAACLGAWFEGALLLFLFSLGHALENRAMERARRAIDALGKLRPETARVKRASGEVVELPVAEVKKGDRVVVRPGDRVPLDGVVREGKSSLDQAAITGESVPVAKAAGDEVFAGTINCEAALEVEVTKLTAETALARVIDMVTQAEAQKSPTQRFTQRFEKRFVPVVLVATPIFAASLLAWHVFGPARMAVLDAVREAFLRGCSLLVAASPCALAIATPAAVLSAVARAASGGVLMKGGAHLEALGKVAAIAFDKTGTLTVGRPKLVTVTPAAGADEAALLGTAAAAEALSSHPIARAIVDGAAARKVAPRTASACEAVHGKGLRAKVDGEEVAIGSLALFADAPDPLAAAAASSVPAEVAAEVAKLEAAGQTVIVVRSGARFLGVLGVADTVRPESRVAIETLHRLGIRRTVMLSGDNLRVARAIATEVGIDEPRAPLLPEGKVDALRELAREGGVAMVGDGVNDAPALAAASVGIAMGGAGSDVALETADVVLMADDLRRLPFAVGLARASSRVVKQNLVIALGVSALLILASICGWVRIGEAVVLHEGSTLVVVANALRLLAYRE